MTDRVDLDALDIGDEDEENRPRRGDWFWHGEGDPGNERTGDEPTADDPMGSEAASDESTVDDATDAGGAETDVTTGDATDSDATDSDATVAGAGLEDEDADVASPAESANGGDSAGAGARTRVPHVPRENENKPVGIPVESGGAGGVSARGAAGAGDESEESDGTVGTEGEPGETGANTAGDESVSPANGGVAAASGPHGSAPSAMTMAFTYGAIQRLASPILVVANAGEWTDWIGVVGDVDAYVINKFVREEGIDIDFFNGAGTGPAERLREISTNPNSMFAAERKVLVGTDADRRVVDRTDWEFVPLTEAAEAAGWDLDEITESTESEGSGE